MPINKMALAAWSTLIAAELWADPHAANDSALLLEKSRFADGDVYIPNLFFRSWNFAAPGHAARVLAWLLLVAAVGGWLARSARNGRGRSPLRALAGMAALVLGIALVLAGMALTTATVG